MFPEIICDFQWFPAHARCLSVKILKIICASLRQQFDACHWIVIMRNTLSELRKLFHTYHGRTEQDSSLLIWTFFSFHSFKAFHKSTGTLISLLSQQEFYKF